MKSLLSFLVTLFVLVMSCSAADNVSFFRRNASLLNGSLSILTTASLTYKLGLTDFKFVGREHTLGIGGTIGYAFTGSLCAPIVTQVFVFTVECLLWHRGMYGSTTAKALAAKPMYAPFLGLLFQCSRHWGINAEFAPLLLHSFIDGQVVSAVPSFSIGVVQTF